MYKWSGANKVQSKNKTNTRFDLLIVCFRITMMVDEEPLKTKINNLFLNAGSIKG